MEEFLTHWSELEEEHGGGIHLEVVTKNRRFSFWVEPNGEAYWIYIDKEYNTDTGTIPREFLEEITKIVHNTEVSD